jgi:membrane-bound ClpP family serine protease
LKVRIGGGVVVVEFPGGGVVSGKIFVEVFGHTGVEVVAVFSECGAEAVSGGVAMNFAVNTI